MPPAPRSALVGNPGNRRTALFTAAVRQAAGAARPADMPGHDLPHGTARG
ncbi:hypothetical protein V1L54_22590 [Streptomyces sp. TRM 70361]|nr:hypothetical protein [Streptomyces sp. TRM 70361]MEE1942152.1 hypothetical protein [Streptomyces sp. TRM 70361]